MNVYSKLALFAGGALFGSAGIKLLSSKDAKNVYSHTTAAVLRMKECVMDTVSTCRRTLPIFWPLPKTSTSSARPRKKRLPAAKRKLLPGKKLRSRRNKKQGRGRTSGPSFLEGL